MTVTQIVELSFILLIGAVWGVIALLALQWRAEKKRVFKDKEDSIDSRIKGLEKSVDGTIYYEGLKDGVKDLRTAVIKLTRDVYDEWIEEKYKPGILKRLENIEASIKVLEPLASASINLDKRIAKLEKAIRTGTHPDEVEL